MLVLLFSFRFYTFRLYNQFQSFDIVFCQLDIPSISVIVEYPFCAMSSQYSMFFCLHVVFYSKLLGIIAHHVPLAYTILGDLYYEPDENGKSNKQLAVEYYMKAEEHAVLGRHGAERVLDYYRNGGNIQLTEDDIKRLELIVQPKGVETE